MVKATAIIYARVSTVRQAEDELPIASQIKVGRDKAAALEASVLKEFVDLGVSGRTDRRPEFQRAIAYCKAHKVTYFITWDSARFSRDRVDAAGWKREVRKAGTQMIFISMNIDPSTDEGWMAEAFTEMMDEAYSRRVSKDTRRSMLKNAADGFYNGGRVPYGYSLVDDGKRKRLQVNEIEAPIVRMIFEAYLGGSGCKQISMALNGKGLSRRGDRWSKTNVGLVLKNHRYIGVSIFNRRDHKARQVRDASEWVTAESHQAIIDRASFDRVQATMHERAPVSDGASPRCTFFLSGLLVCPSCGGKMKGETATGRGGRRYAYYNCAASLAGKGCMPRRVVAREFEDFVAREVVRALLTEERVLDIVTEIRASAATWAEERKQTRDLLVLELRDVEAKRDRLFVVLESEELSACNLPDINVRLRRHQVRVQEIESALAALEAVPDELVGETEAMDPDEAAQAIAGAIMECEDPFRMRIFFQDFIQKIEIRETDLVISYDPRRMLGATAPRSSLTTNREGDLVQSKERWLPELGSNQRPAD